MGSITTRSAACMRINSSRCGTLSGKKSGTRSDSSRAITRSRSAPAASARGRTVSEVLSSAPRRIVTWGRSMACVMVAPRLSRDGQVDTDERLANGGVAVEDREPAALQVRFEEPAERGGLHLGERLGGNHGDTSGESYYPTIPW